MATSLAAACWLAAPAGATGPLDGAQAPGAAPGAATAAATQPVVDATGSVEGAVGGVASAASPATDATVGRLAKSVAVPGKGARPEFDSVVREVADTVAGAAPAAAPVVAPAVERVTGATEAARGPGRAGGDTAGPPPRRSRGAGRIHDRHPVSGAVEAVPAQAAVMRQRRAAGAASGPDFAPFDLIGWAPQAGLLASQDLTGLVAGVPASPAVAAHAAPDSPSSPGPGPASGGGSPFSGSTTSFSLGGLAVLLATLSLAGPALRRRLPRPAFARWPAAFVPLLERPG